MAVTRAFTTGSARVVGQLDFHADPMLRTGQADDGLLTGRTSHLMGREVRLTPCTAQMPSTNAQGDLGSGAHVGDEVIVVVVSLIAYERLNTDE